MCLFVMCRTGGTAEDATWLPVTCLSNHLGLYECRAVNGSSADFPESYFTADRMPRNTAGNVTVHGFGDSCAIMVALG